MGNYRSNPSFCQSKEKGQVLLITLLVLSVAATFVLSIIGRSTTDVAMTNQTAESSLAFAAAEAGIEQVLKTGVGTGAVTLSPGVSYTAIPFTVGGAAGSYQFPKKTSVDSAETLWLVNHNADGSLNEIPTYGTFYIDLCWSGGPPVPAALVSVLYKRGASYYVARGGYDPVPASRSPANNFTIAATETPATHCPIGSGTNYRRTIRFDSVAAGFGLDFATDVIIAMRIQPVYSDAQFAVYSDKVIPQQGNRIESTGTIGNGITRKIVVFQQYRSPPSIFDNVIYSQANFTK